MEINSKRNVEKVGRMTNCQRVKMCYSECECIKVPRGYCVFGRINEQIYSFGFRQSERGAWSIAWKKTQQRMLEKLEG